MLRTRFFGRAEPLFVDPRGLRSAASLWSGAQMWVQLLRAHPHSPSVVVWQTDRLALLQLLVAALWDGRSLSIEATASGPWPDALCLDGGQVMHGGQAVCGLGDGGWPDLPGTPPLSPRDMLTTLPADGNVAVRGQQAGHGDLWLALGAPLSQPPSGLPATTVQTAPRTEVLAPFDLASLNTPDDVLNDALIPLLRSHEVWEHAALPAA